MAERVRLVEVVDVCIDESIDELLYVNKPFDHPGFYRGWKKELLVEKITSSSEEKLLLCTLCKGMLRDACVFAVNEKYEARCKACFFEPFTADVRKKAELIQSVIDEKLIHCPVCKWTGPTVDVEYHLEQCDYLVVPCPLGCLDKTDTIQKIQRRFLESHMNYTCPMRLVPCEYCQSEIKASNVNSHMYMCEEYPMQCPNKCTFQSENGEIFAASRKVINNHLKTDCRLQQIACPYSEYGCQDKILRKDLHLSKLDSLKHLSLVESCLKSTRVDLQNKVNETVLLKNVKSPLSIGGIEWRVMNFEHRKLGKDFKSPPFYCCGYKLCFTIAFNIDKHIGIYLKLLKGENDDTLTWPFKSEISIILVEECLLKANGNYENSFLTEEMPDINCFGKPSSTRRNELFGFCYFMSHAEIQSKYQNTDDSILLRILCKC